MSDSEKPDQPDKSNTQTIFQVPAIMGKLGDADFKIPRHPIPVHNAWVIRRNGLFTLILLETAPGGAAVECVAHAMFDPVTLKQMYNAIGQQLDAYEKAHGVVDVAPTQVPSLMN